MSTLLIDSNYIKVYPTAYRGTNGSTDDAKAFNPESRLNSEFNITNGLRRLRLQDSYIKEYDESNKKITFCIAGYWFNIFGSGYDELRAWMNENPNAEGVWACIKVSPLNGDTYTGTEYEAYSLVSLDESGSPTELDIKSGDVFRFYGLMIVGEDPEEDPNNKNLSLKLFEKEEESGGGSFKICQHSLFQVSSNMVEDLDIDPITGKNKNEGKNISEIFTTGDLKTTNINTTSKITTKDLEVTGDASVSGGLSVNLDLTAGRSLQAQGDVTFSNIKASSDKNVPLVTDSNGEVGSADGLEYDRAQEVWNVTAIKSPTQFGNYGVCSSSKSTVNKTVRIEGFGLAEGVSIHVKFTNENTASNPKLNVNNTGALPLRIGTSTAASNPDSSWRAGDILELVYDGTSWIICKSIPQLGYFGECLTSSTTRDKTVDIEGFKLDVGAQICVWFKYSNTALLSPTLNVNNTGAKTILDEGFSLRSDKFYELMYTGTNWVVLNPDRVPVATNSDNAAVAAKLQGLMNTSSGPGCWETINFGPNDSQKAYAWDPHDILEVRVGAPAAQHGTTTTSGFDTALGIFEITTSSLNDDKPFYSPIFSWSGHPLLELMFLDGKIELRQINTTTGSSSTTTMGRNWYVEIRLVQSQMI